MKDLRLTHRQIEAFRALMLSGSVTEAGQLLSVTQPAVSKILSQLEAELGFALFDRRQGTLNPTAEAHILYAEVDRSFAGLDRVAQAARRIRDRTGGSLRVAVMPTLSTGFIVDVARRVCLVEDEMQLSIQTYGSEEVVDLVASGLFDVGFATTPVDATRVVKGPVLSVPSFCILPPGHRLVAPGPISIVALEAERFVATAPGTPSRMRADSLFASLNVSRQVVIEARWSLTVAELVAAGLGCGIVDGFTAMSFARRGGVVRPLQEQLDFAFVHVVPQGAVANGGVRRFLHAFTGELATFRQQLDTLGRSAGLDDRADSEAGFDAGDAGQGGQDGAV